MNKMATEQRMIYADEVLRMIGNSKTDNPYLHTMGEAVWNVAHDCAKSCVDACPTVDAEPVVHGKWKEREFGMAHECSECGHCEIYILPNFCPNCGAKMDGGVSDGN